MNTPILRNELKFYIARPDAFWLAEQLSKVLSPDPHAGENGMYKIRSLYFDDPQASAVKEKRDGLMNREKYRIRFYNHDDSFIQLEKKSKLGDKTTKEAVRITKSLCEKILAGDIDGLLSHPDRLMREFFIRMRTRALKPAVIVDYERAPYLHPASDLRITIDSNLHTGLWNTDLFEKDLPTLPVLTEGRVILEVKFNQIMPDYIDRLIRCIPRERMAISKFVLCSEAL